VDGAVRVFELGSTRFDVTGQLDLVRADLLGGGGPVPRIPPLRLIGGVEASGGAIGGRLEVEHATKQDRVAQFETETAGWTMVNASLNWKPFGADSATTIVASLNNLFDVSARRHASLLKDYAPLPGRDFRISARLSF
jgi:iron complex outermembrane receptor protein